MYLCIWYEGIWPCFNLCEWVWASNYVVCDSVCCVVTRPGRGLSDHSMFVCIYISHIVNN